ncbi:MAG: hypothetical protein GY845_22390 [Planctomycetes bacterium]|nr:hypothetical protein [Planctomycetota bacterium]
MWRTDPSDRILEGAEAKLFAESLLSLVDELDLCAFEYELGIKCFDAMTVGQKISVLSTIGNGLFRKDVDLVELTAVLESGIGAVFKHLSYKIALEIDIPELGSDWRELLVAARKEMEAEDIPKPTCEDLNEWDIELEGLANAILWDRDYEDGDIYMDHPPEKTEWLKYMAMISDNYYTAIADDLTDEEAQVKIKELKELCNLVIKPI